MTRIFLTTTAAILCALSPAALASPAAAERIQRTHELASEKWLLELKLAATPEARETLHRNRPDPATALTSLWQIIGPSLAEDWTIPHSAWFLRTSLTVSPQPAFTRERQLVISSFAQNHLEKPGIIPFCIALIDSADPQALTLLERIQSEHPDKVTQGIAALGAALLLRPLGDEGEIMKKRLTYLRKAIIESADETIGQTTVANIAADELHIIHYLSKGRTAPDLAGNDMSGRPGGLAAHKGRIIVLLFWDGQMEETDKVIDLTNQLVTKYHDQPVTVLGVTNEEVANIRNLQATDVIRWNNLHDPDGKLAHQYRIRSKPSVFVLDGERTIHYVGLPGSFAELTVDALLAPPQPNP